MTNLSPHFPEEEFLRSATAKRLGINNTWTVPAHRENAILLCKNYMEPIREATREPISISSGYRVEKLNKAIGGSVYSAHCFGLADDFTCKGLDLKALFNLIQTLEESGKIPTFDQLIFEFDSWIHLGIRLEGNRGQVLRATKDRKGQTLYLPVGRLA